MEEPTIVSSDPENTPVVPNRPGSSSSSFSVPLPTNIFYFFNHFKNSSLQPKEDIEIALYTGTYNSNDREVYNRLFNNINVCRLLDYIF